MKRIIFWLIVLLWVIICWNVLWYDEMVVYSKLYKTKVLNTGDIMEIHKSIVITGECLGLWKWNWHITTENTWNQTKIKEIVLNVCDQKTFEYMLLHEIWHFVKRKYDLRIPLLATTPYSKTSDDEMYAESFAYLYF